MKKLLLFSLIVLLVLPAQAKKTGVNELSPEMKRLQEAARLTILVNMQNLKRFLMNC